MAIEVVTLGCRLNAVESEAMRGAAAEAGLDDVAIVNSCAVTTEAVRQARQSVRALARARPGRPVVVTGCAAQVAPGDFARMPEVARVIGNAAKTRPETWAEARAALDGDAPRVAVDDVMTLGPVTRAIADRPAGRVRAFLQVQNGCDHRCTFCIIPFGRGNARSVLAHEVVAEARRLVEAGVPEIVLTGVDLTSWGAGLPGSPRLGALVRLILREVTDLARLRLSSLDVAEVDDDLRAAFAEEERLMPHLHLSLQAGDDLVLARMKRRHRRADALSLCEDIRHLRPDIVFGADLIAGFPTETSAMAARTRALVEDCGLSFVHVFPFSPRPGTPAARMPQVPPPEVRERAALLRDAGAAALARHLASEVGRRRPVLVEHGGRGRTPGFAEVVFDVSPPPGLVVEVEIAGHDGRRLRAA